MAKPLCKFSISMYIFFSLEKGITDTPDDMFRLAESELPQEGAKKSISQEILKQSMSKTADGQDALRIYSMKPDGKCFFQNLEQEKNEPSLRTASSFLVIRFMQLGLFHLFFLSIQKLKEKLMTQFIPVFNICAFSLHSCY